MIFNLKIQTQLFLGFWARETNGAIRQAAQRANWFVDVGAGSGELCILVAKLKNVTRIIAIEPDQAMVKSLQANLDRSERLYNDILSGRIEIIEKFIGTQNGDKCITLDQLNIDHLLHGFISIDVDGSELEVLRSGQQLLSYTNVDILVETHSSELERNCVKFLDRVGYTTPIRLTHTTTRCRVLPVAGIKLGIGRRLCIASDAEQRSEGVERVEAPVKPKREFVEVGL